MLASKLNAFANNESGKYAGGLEWHTIRASHVRDAPMTGQGGMKLQGKRSASERWLINDTPAETNCSWRCLFVCNNAGKASTLTAEQMIKDGASSLKLRYKAVSAHGDYVSTADIQAIVDKNLKKKFAVQLYNNIFEKTGPPVVPAPGGRGLDCLERFAVWPP